MNEYIYKENRRILMAYISQIKYNKLTIVKGVAVGVM